MGCHFSSEMHSFGPFGDPLGLNETRTRCNHCSRRKEGGGAGSRYSLRASTHRYLKNSPWGEDGGVAMGTSTPPPPLALSLSSKPPPPLSAGRSLIQTHCPLLNPSGARLKSRPSISAMASWLWCVFGFSTQSPKACHRLFQAAYNKPSFGSKEISEA